MDTKSRITDLLTQIDAGGDTFATKFTLHCDPQIEVQGMGSVVFPISSKTAHHLCALAQPACHGYKDQTRLDTQVRDTWEIPATQIRFQNPAWNHTLSQVVRRVRADLGMPDTGNQVAELDKLLIYGPGQFFVTHQDTEKVDGMLATLSITLPSDFSGGELAVTHQNQTLRSRGSDTNLSLVAFYADCQHEVRPVTEGYRVSLTYKLILTGAEPPEPAPTETIAVLAAALQRYWNTPQPGRRPQDDPRPAPDRLVFLLDHQYTQRSLSWKHLKGADRARVLALRRAAQTQDAELAMALAEIHETWSVEHDIDPYRESRYRRSSRQPDESDMQLQDLLVDKVELRHWCCYEGEPPQPAISPVTSEELCFIRPTVDFDPFESEYEGYMGNYGDTMDRWYHRAALVLWPKNKRFIMQARQDPIWGMLEIDRLLQTGQRKLALDQLQRLMPHWTTGRLHDSNRQEVLSSILPLAIHLKEPLLADALLQPFSLEDLQCDAITDFFVLADTYGSDWIQACVQRWQSARRNSYRFPDWISNVLPALAQTSRSDIAPLVSEVARGCWSWLDQQLVEILKIAGRKERGPMMRKLAPAVLASLKVADNLKNDIMRQEIVGLLLVRNYPLDFSMSILRDAQGTPAWGSLSPLKDHILAVLTDILAAPPRQLDDWSIPAPGNFPAIAGQDFISFLDSSKQQSLIWPLAKAGRQRIQAWIEHHDLPIKCSVINAGSPHKLFLEKTDTLFTSAVKQRAEMMKAMAWLRSMTT